MSSWSPTLLPVKSLVFSGILLAPITSTFTISSILLSRAVALHMSVDYSNLDPNSSLSPFDPPPRQSIEITVQCSRLTRVYLRH